MRKGRLAGVHEGLAVMHERLAVWITGLQERIVHEQLAAGKGGWRGRHGYYMPAPADRLVRTCSYDVPLAHGVD